MTYMTMAQIKDGLKNLQDRAQKTQDNSWSHGYMVKAKTIQRNQEIMNDNLTLLDHEVNELLKKYGDIMKIVDGFAPFQKAVKEWGVYPQALTNACKNHGVAKVLDSIRYTSVNPAARNKAAFLFAVLKNGKKALR